MSIIYKLTECGELQQVWRGPTDGRGHGGVTNGNSCGKLPSDRGAGRAGRASDDPVAEVGQAVVPTMGFACRRHHPAGGVEAVEQVELLEAIEDWRDERRVVS